MFLLSTALISTSLPDEALERLTRRRPEIYEPLVTSMRLNRTPLEKDAVTSP